MGGMPAAACAGAGAGAGACGGCAGVGGVPAVLGRDACGGLCGCGCGCGCLRRPVRVWGGVPAALGRGAAVALCGWGWDACGGLCRCVGVRVAPAVSLWVGAAPGGVRPRSAVGFLGWGTGRPASAAGGHPPTRPLPAVRDCGPDPSVRGTRRRPAVDVRGPPPPRQSAGSRASLREGDPQGGTGGRWGSPSGGGSPVSAGLRDSPGPAQRRAGATGTPGVRGRRPAPRRSQPPAS
ncbi:hypothetical protein StrepF001_13910 [Streptomyces sp. F001]|nr:hypothetical protein StrepF001_13910 [Streptomyces sp. F001]